MDQETANKQAAVNFLQLASSGRVEDAYKQYAAEDFVHHNPYFISDRESLKAGMIESASKNPERTFEVQRVLEDGELVAVHSRVQQHPGQRAGAVVHIFRFAAGKIVELWDVGQIEPEEMINERGMF